MPIGPGSKSMTQRMKKIKEEWNWVQMRIAILERGSGSIEENSGGGVCMALKRSDF